MKKLFAILAVMGVLSFGTTLTAMAQDESAAPATEQVAAADNSAAVVAEEGGLHKELKTKFIEGDAGFMSLPAIALVLGLAFCIERIIYLSLAEVNAKKLMGKVEAALEKGDVEGAKTICRNTRGPVASICYQGLMRIDEGLDVVERSVVSYGGYRPVTLKRVALGLPCLSPWLRLWDLSVPLSVWLWPSIRSSRLVISLRQSLQVV